MPGLWTAQLGTLIYSQLGPWSTPAALCVIFWPCAGLRREGAARIQHLVAAGDGGADDSATFAGLDWTYRRTAPSVPPAPCPVLSPRESPRENPAPNEGFWVAVLPFKCTVQHET